MAPKVIQAFRFRRNPARGQNKDRIRVTGFASPDSGTKSLTLKNQSSVT